MIGTKRYENIAGRQVPAIQVSESKTEMVSFVGQDGRTRNIPGQFADLVSLRETNPNGPNPGQEYLTLTRENLRFTELRFDYVVGLDVTEGGDIITIPELEAKRGENIRARQTERLAAQTPQVVSLTAE